MYTEQQRDWVLHQKNNYCLDGLHSLHLTSYSSEIPTNEPENLNIIYTE